MASQLSHKVAILSQKLSWITTFYHCFRGAFYFLILVSGMFLLSELLAHYWAVGIYISYSLQLQTHILYFIYLVVSYLVFELCFVFLAIGVLAYLIFHVERKKAQV